MPLNVEAAWSKPFLLSEASSGAIYECADLAMIPEVAGIYVFLRKHGPRISPLYVGKSSNVRTRLKQHLNSVKLMQALYEAEAGARQFMYCEPKVKPGQELGKVLSILENALIDHAMSEGYDLRQKQGLKPPHHTISFTGNRTSEAVVGRFMRVRV